MPTTLPPELFDAPLSDPRLEKLKQRDARVQLGTLGRGNHFLEFQADEDDHLWVMVHSGSRGVGQAIASHHLTNIPAQKAGSRQLATLDADTTEGRAYLADADWAVRYAEFNRLAMLAVVRGLMYELFSVDGIEESLIHTNHNHVRRETHDDCEYYIHRKGAHAHARLG